MAIARLHGGFVHPRRVRVLASHAAHLLPEGARCLDVGCGDGRFGAELRRLRPDLRILGLELKVRPGTRIPVAAFNGVTLPCADGAVDAVILVDVLHHSRRPRALLAAAARAARRMVVVKDHLRQGVLAGPTLHLMDLVGNARFGTAKVYQYWTPEQWRRAFAELGLSSLGPAGAWQTRLGLYPWPFRLVFERSLHFMAALEPTGGEAP